MTCYLPSIYLRIGGEYMKAALNNDLYFKPLAFVYPEDTMALQVEDQMLLSVCRGLNFPVISLHRKSPVLLRFLILLAHAVSAGRDEVCQVPAGWYGHGGGSGERSSLCGDCPERGHAGNPRYSQTDSTPFVKFLPDGTIFEEVLTKGHHYVEIALNEVPLFIRSGKCIRD